MAASAETAHHVGLRENAVSLWGDFVVSIANVAPSSSVAYTLALLVARSRATSHRSPSS